MCAGDRCPSPPCHPSAVGARSPAKREVEGVLARECADVERVIGVGAGLPSSRGRGMAIHVDVGMADSCAGQAARRS
jgi:hypothetical protein